MSQKARSDTYEHLIGSVVLVPVSRGKHKRGPSNNAQAAFLVTGCGVSWGQPWIACTPVQGKGKLITSVFEVMIELDPLAEPP